MCLWNTNSSEDLIFPDEMVKKGFAVMKNSDPEFPAPNRSASFTELKDVVDPPSLSRSQSNQSNPSNASDPELPAPNRSASFTQLQDDVAPPLSRSQSNHSIASGDTPVVNPLGASNSPNATVNCTAGIEAWDAAMNGDYGMLSNDPVLV